jgi:NAD(P)-dependent dehydrogenase (short-subunit alcohol dehydrogenase family)
MNLELTGRKAIISGANRGIGRTIALAFAREGMHVGLLGRNEQACGDLADEISRQHGGVKAVPVYVDLEQPQTIDPAVAKAVSALGGVDVLVNCAGGAYRGRLGEIPDEMWERYFKVKPLGLIRVTRAAFPHLKKSSQARVINISGTRGREPEAHSTMSGPINFGTNSVTKALANEFGAFGITVNAICPGSTRTRRWDELVAITAR